MNYPLAERFVSINGEGACVGELAVFLRFSGCNLACSYCDTSWVNEEKCPVTYYSLQDLLAYVEGAEISNVTITGGEPLLQPGIGELIDALAALKDLRIEIETNGSVPLAPFICSDSIHITMDYKLPGSGMERWMCLNNLTLLRPEDSLKFVCGDIDDLRHASDVISTYDLIGRVPIYFSPVFGKIDPKEIVHFMKRQHLNQVKLQLQMHKQIWNVDQRGV